MASSPPFTTAGSYLVSSLRNDHSFLMAAFATSVALIAVLAEQALRCPVAVFVAIITFGELAGVVCDAIVGTVALFYHCILFALYFFTCFAPVLFVQCFLFGFVVHHRLCLSLVYYCGLELSSPSESTIAAPRRCVETKAEQPFSL